MKENIYRAFVESLKIEKVLLLNDYNEYYDEFRKVTYNIHKRICDSNSVTEASFRDDFAKQYNKLRQDLLEVYRYYVKGDVLRASTKMSNIFFRRKYYNKKFCEYFLTSEENVTLYRARKDKELIKKPDDLLNQMFHIAFIKREKVGNCRFSVSGLPCLYLDSSIKCCRKELGAETIDELTICTYHHMDYFPYYDLTLNDEDIVDFNQLKIYLLKSLIIQAISFRVYPEKESKPNFTPHYVISQLLTAAVVANGIKSKQPQCIRYRSVKFLEDHHQYNYVFIPQIHNYRYDKLYDMQLYNKFEINLWQKR